MSSEIPVGSPPVPPGRHAAPGGWYPDPANPAQERYWDGWQWSRNTRPVDPPAAPAPRVGSGWQQQPYQQQPYQQQPYQQQPYQQPYGQQQPYRVAQGPTTADGVPLAGWWWRALAVVIDAFIVGAISSLLTLPIYRRMAQGLTDYLTAVFEAASRGAALPPQPDVTTMISANDQLILLGVGLVVHTAYIALFLRWRKATPGKLVVGLRVVPVDEGRSTARLSWSAVIIRALFWTIPNLATVLLVLRLVDVLMPLWNPKRQALHDLAAKTQVVKIR